MISDKTRRDIEQRAFEKLEDMVNRLRHDLKVEYTERLELEKRVKRLEHSVEPDLRYMI